MPLLGNLVGIAVDPLRFQARHHARLGPLFRARLLGRRLVFVDSVGHPALGREFFDAPDDRLDMVTAYRDLLGGLLGEDLFVPIARELRAGLGLGYIRRHLPRSAGVALRFLREQLDAAESLDVVRTCNDLVIQFVCDYLTGGELRDAERVELAELFHLIESDYSVLGMLSPFETRAFRRRVAARERARALLRSAVERRCHGTRSEDDLLQHLLDHASARRGGVVDAEAIREISLQLVGTVFAAHTNTAMTLALCLAELVERPALFARVRASVLECGSDGDPGGSPVAAPPVVHRVITECVRVHGRGACWRRATRDQELGGFGILEGEYVGTSLGRINLDPHRYPSPRVFDVDRPVPGERDRFESPPVHGCPITFAAFGAGEHLCSGRALGYSMLGVLLSALVREYDWRIEKKPRAWYPLLFPGVSRPIGSFRMSARLVRARR